MRKLITLLAIIVPFLVSCKHEVYYEIITKVQPDGAGSIIMSPSSDQVKEGTVVEFTATPNEFWTFDHWEGSITGTNNPAHLTVSDYISVKAVFVENDPGIVFTETDFVSPQEMARRMGLGIALAAGFGEVENGTPVENHLGNGIVTQQTFDKYKEAGIKTARIPVAWMSKVGPAPDYLIDKDYLDRVAEVVEYAENEGMNAIININTDEVYEWLDLERGAEDLDFRKGVSNKLTAMWKQIGRRFRDKGDFLIFESFSELWIVNSPVDLDFNDSYLGNKNMMECFAEWCQVFVDAVRSTGGNNASRWLTIPSPCANVDIGLVRYDLPQDYVSKNRYLYSFHYYRPVEFTDALIGEWGHTATVFTEETIRYGEAYVIDLFSRVKKAFIDRGIPVYLGEFGCENRLNDHDIPYHLYYYEFISKVAKENYLAPMIWEDGLEGTHRVGLFNRSTGEYIRYGDRVMAVLNRAIYNDDPTYTIQSVYNDAPYPENEDTTSFEIPDPVFRQYLIDNFDLDKDGAFSSREAQVVKEISISTENIASLEGIESFVILKHLTANGSVRGMGKLASLDLSKNHQIQEVSILNNEVSVLNISGCEKLKCLLCWENRLTELDLSNCPNLEELCCAQNHLTSIDVSKCPKLRIFAPNENDLEELDLSNNPLLEEVEIYNNPRLKVVWLKKGQTIRHFMKDAFTEIRYKD